MKGKAEMLRKISHSIAYFFVRKKIIDIEYIEIYQYGVEQIISTLTSVLTIIIMGLLSGNVLLAIIFLIFFIPLRIFTGGHHEDSYLRCYLSFIFIFIVEVFIVNTNVLSNYSSIAQILTIISIIIISILSPVEHKNKPLAKHTRKKHKITAVTIVIIEFGIAFLLLNYNEKLFYAAIISIVIVALLQIIAILYSFNNLGEKGKQK